MVPMECGSSLHPPWFRGVFVSRLTWVAAVAAEDFLNFQAIQEDTLDVGVSENRLNP